MEISVFISVIKNISLHKVCLYLTTWDLWSWNSVVT